MSSISNKTKSVVNLFDESDDKKTSKQVEKLDPGEVKAFPEIEGNLVILSDGAFASLKNIEIDFVRQRVVLRESDEKVEAKAKAK